MEPAHERRCLDLLLGSGRLGEWQVRRGDRIDFVLVSGASRIGVEVTRVFDDETGSGSADREEAAHWAQVMELAKAIHRMRAPTHGWVVVRVCPNPARRLSRGRIRDVAAWLAGSVAPLCFSAHESYSLTSEESCDAEFPDEILTVDATWLEPGGQPEWMTSGFAWASSANSEAIQRALRRKETKVAGYESGLSQRWCLLVFDGSVPASLRFLQPHSGKHTYTSSFNRAFILDCAGHSAEISLRLPHPGPPNGRLLPTS